MSRRGPGKTDYGPEARQLILDRMCGGQSLTAICRLPDMPHITTVQEWLAKEPEFAAAYDRAREIMCDFLVQEAIEIADDRSRDRDDPQAVNRSRIQVDIRKWSVSKLFPKRYGDKVDTTVEVTVTMTQEQRDQRLVELLSRLPSPQLTIEAEAEDAA